MSTETRIGIVAGLLIVVVASVYFFYGNRHAADDVLVAANPKQVESLKIPRGEEPSTPTKQVSDSSPKSGVTAPLGAPPMQVRRYQPPADVVREDTVAGSETALAAGSPRNQPAQGIDKYRMTEPTAPAESSAPLLRTSASPLLVEATHENLQKDTPAGVPIPARSPPAVKPPAPTETGPESASPKSSSQRIVIAPERETPAGKPPVPGEKTKSPTVTPNVATPAPGKTYTVQPGDSLYGIARKLYENGSRWEEIYNLNKAQLRNDPKRLRPGMILKLPAD